MPQEMTGPNESTSQNPAGADTSHQSRGLFESSWTLSLFGTAVGAGILFLPMNAGAGGMWPLIIATLLIGPMTFFAHRGLSRFVSASQNPGADITIVARGLFGEFAGQVEIGRASCRERVSIRWWG